jgi:hypothetical protein
MFPELPDASMDTRKPIAFPQCSLDKSNSGKCSPTNFQNHRIAHPSRQRRKAEFLPQHEQKTESAIMIARGKQTS